MHETAFLGPVRIVRCTRIPGKKYVQWYSTIESVSQTQAPAAAAQDSGTSIRRQLIKRHVMLEEDVDASRKVIGKTYLLALARAALVALVHVNGYRLGEVRVEVLRLFLRKRISCNDCDVLVLTSS